MKSSSSYRLVPAIILFFSLSWPVKGVEDFPGFVQCLKTLSNPSYPITASIYTPFNTTFESILISYVRNLRSLVGEDALKRPLAIVTAMHESHVQATVLCSKAHGLMLRTRSGGHDTEGLSWGSERVPFVLLDMFNFRNMSLDLAARTMWVQSGATLGEVYYTIANSSNTLAFPAGLCPTVATGGHFSGGGFGTMVRKYGLSIDNIVDAQAVDIKGRILDRKTMGEDLFWAINGGGAASFAVVLAWKIKLVPVPETVTVFNVYRTIDQNALEIVEKWQEAATTIDDNLFIRLELRAVNQTVQARFLGLYLGNSDMLLSVMNESFLELRLQRNDCMEMSWIESVLFFYDFPPGTPTTALLSRKLGLIFAKTKSDYVTEPIKKQGLNVIFQKMIEIQDVFMQWNPYGGIMNKIPATQTPQPNRAGYLFKIQYLAVWSKEEMSDRFKNASRQLFDVMTPYVSKSPREAFLNYRDLDIGYSPYCNATYEEAKVYGLKYFTVNFDRLVQVKTEVDPDNFFRYEQSVPVLPRNSKHLM